MPEMLQTYKPKDASRHRHRPRPGLDRRFRRNGGSITASRAGIPTNRLRKNLCNPLVFLTPNNLLMKCNRCLPTAKGMFVLTLLAVAALAGALPSRAQERVIAYSVPAGTAGNQDFGGVLGMDFDVINPVTITRLGVFDDQSDGLNLPITARLWDRATLSELASVEFTPEEPGELVGGSRFKMLPTPLPLEVGFQGTISAEGYGAEERLRNRLTDAANIVWTTQDGNGSLQFVGSSRYGLTPGFYPDGVDEGPAARYAAGTFEFETSPPLLPGKPIVLARSGDGQVSLSWPPVTTPLPADKYRVARSADLAGPFTQIAEVTSSNYTDLGLTNGITLFYRVQAVSTADKVGPDSDLKRAVPWAIPPDQLIAYFTPVAGGNQDFAGALGMDFDVDNPVIVTRLGVFDDQSDGLKLPITARIYDRTDGTVVAEMRFEAGEGEPIESMRFKELPEPLRLAAGFSGIIQADGYGAEELLLNSHGDTNAVVWTLHDGNGSLRFVGSSRYGADPTVMPDGIDGGPAARYAAGTFQYQILPPERPGIPQLQVQLPSEDGAVTLVWTPVAVPLPAARYVVLRAEDPAGPFTQVGESTATSFRDTGLVNGTVLFYLVRAVASEGQTGRDSNVVSARPQARVPGVAYVNLNGFAGTQDFGGSIGMDFDVVKPVKVTRLGVFDDGADGIYLPLTAVLYNRDTGEPMASLEFTSEDPGELIDSSRFKDLPQPVSLAGGFKGVIAASGYGLDERLYNNAQAIPERLTYDGGSLLFVGSGRYGEAGQFPTTPDGGSLPNRYAAGTFYFEPVDEVPATRLNVSALTAGKFTITWSGASVLQAAPDLTGTWADLAEARSGIEIAPSENRRFYRLRQ